MTGDYLPPGLYSYLVKIAEENKLSFKEIKTMLIRKGLQDLGFVCDHSVVGMAKVTGLPYCQRCWTRLNTIKPPTYFKGKLVKPGEYWPIETFLDKFYKEMGQYLALDPESKAYIDEMNGSTRESKFEHEKEGHYI